MKKQLTAKTILALVVTAFIAQLVAGCGESGGAAAPMSTKAAEHLKKIKG